MKNLLTSFQLADRYVFNGLKKLIACFVISLASVFFLVLAELAYAQPAPYCLKQFPMSPLRSGDELRSGRDVFTSCESSPGRLACSLDSMKADKNITSCIINNFNQIPDDIGIVSIHGRAPEEELMKLYERWKTDMEKPGACPPRRFIAMACDRSKYGSWVHVASWWAKKTGIPTVGIIPAEAGKDGACWGLEDDGSNFFQLDDSEEQLSCKRRLGVFRPNGAQPIVIRDPNKCSRIFGNLVFNEPEAPSPGSSLPRGTLSRCPAPSTAPQCPTGPCFYTSVDNAGNLFGVTMIFAEQATNAISNGDTTAAVVNTGATAAGAYGIAYSAAAAAETAEASYLACCASTVGRAAVGLVSGVSATALAAGTLVVGGGILIYDVTLGDGNTLRDETGNLGGNRGSPYDMGRLPNDPRGNGPGTYVSTIACHLPSQEFNSNSGHLLCDPETSKKEKDYAKEHGVAPGSCASCH